MWSPSKVVHHEAGPDLSENTQEQHLQVNAEHRKERSTSAKQEEYPTTQKCIPARTAQSLDRKLFMMKAKRTNFQ